MTPETGSAREIAPGRLADFENSSDADQPSTPLLPPRRSTGSRSPKLPPRASGPAKKPVERPARRSTPPEPAESATAPEKPAKGPEDRVRPSNVHIPVTLLDPLVAKCKADGLSHGEVIIIAIEQTYPRLQDLIHPAATAGGGLFASRRSRAARSTDGPLTPLNYRLREADFKTLDKLVDEFGASSRGHLITAALSDYLDSN